MTETQTIPSTLDVNQRAFRTLLEEGGESSAEIWRQLRGFDLQLKKDEPPYLVLAELAVVNRAARSLAKIVARALSDAVDAPGNLPSRPEKALYNLLHLCIELRDDELLGPAVWKLYDRRAVQGFHRGAELVDVLRGAMIYNQPDRDTGALWRGLLQGAPDAYVGGRKVDGFRGAIRSIEVQKLRGEARVYKLGEYFRMLFQNMSGPEENSRAAIGERELDHLLQTYPEIRKNDILEASGLKLDFASWSEIMEEIETRWPSAPKALPILKELLDGPTDDRDRAYLIKRAYKSGLRLLQRGEAAEMSRDALFQMSFYLWNLRHYGPTISEARFRHFHKAA